MRKEKDRKMGITPIAIRPHHGMCLAYFQGKGYSEGFTGHMQEMKERFESNPQVKLVVDAGRKSVGTVCGMRFVVPIDNKNIKCYNVITENVIHGERNLNNNALRWVLTTEYECKDKRGFYGYTQRSMAYKSNRIEGSTLTEDQTAALFEEGDLPAADEYYKSKDIEEMIKQFHYELKAGVFEVRANGYAIGEYKKIMLQCVSSLIYIQGMISF